MCVCVYHIYTDDFGSQKGFMSDPLELELRVFVDCLLCAEPSPLKEWLSALNHGDLSSP